jgi:hypothetical protein
MGKRSDFPRIERDAYDTPAEAVMPLLDHLKPRTRFIDPCAGAGCLANHFERFGHICVGRFDLPDRDATSARYDDVELAAIFLSNLPWERTTLHPAIINLSDQRLLWTLLDADWVHTKQAIPFKPRLQKIVSVGRVRWIPNSPYDGKDNCCWYLFDRPRPDECAVTFHGRVDYQRRAA